MLVNTNLIKQAGVGKVAKAARVNEAALLNSVNLGSTLPKDALARISKAIHVNQDGKIIVSEVPMSKPETAEDRLRRILTKGGNLRNFARFIHRAMQDELGPEDDPPKYELILRDVARAADGDAEMTGGLTAEQINEYASKCKMSEEAERTSSRAGRRGESEATRVRNSAKKFVNFVFNETEKAGMKLTKVDISYAIKRGGLARVAAVIKRSQIEAYAREYYGYNAAKVAKEEQAQALAEMRERTAHNVKERVAKSRANKKHAELARLAEKCGLPDIPEVRSAAILQRRLEPFQERAATLGLKIKRLVSGFGLLDQANDETTS
jgi:hypothetical protein